MKLEVQHDANDDSLDWGDFSQLRPLDDDDDSNEGPDVELRNPKLFDLSGESESVSTIGNSIASVTFQDQDDINTLSDHTPTSNKSAHTSASTSTRMGTLEEANKQTTDEVASLRTELNAFISLIRTQLPLKPVASDPPSSQATGNP